MSTVLVVDDDPDIRLLFEVELSFTGHEVLHAGDGDEALELIRQRDVDLMLLDIMMPRVSGEDVLRRLGPDFETPIVVITGKQRDLHLRYLELGAVDVIGKPFELGGVIDLVDALLRSTPAERHERRLRRIAELRGGS